MTRGHDKCLLSMVLSVKLTSQNRRSLTEAYDDYEETELTLVFTAQHCRI